jgi:hypothetical protein
VDRGDPVTILSHRIPLAQARDVADTVRIALHGTFGQRTLDALPAVVWLRLASNASVLRFANAEEGVTRWLQGSPVKEIVRCTLPDPVGADGVFVTVEIGAFHEPDVRPVRPDWGRLSGLLEGARARGFDPKTIDYLEQCLGLCWATATHEERKKKGAIG